MSLNIDWKKLKLNNGRTVEQQLRYEANRFLQILQEEIDEWYDSYNPFVYERTGWMRKSIYANDYVDVSVSGTHLSVQIKYSDKAMHDSLWGGGKVNTLLLMNNGYQVSSGWHKNIPYFGYREGGHFLESTVERFNKDNYFGVQILFDYK